MTEQPPFDPNADPPPPPGYGPPGQEGYGTPPPGYGPPPPGYGPPGYGPPGYGPPPGYGYPGYGPPPGTSQKAIWGLVCAIAGFCCGPLGVVGIILGWIAKGETERTGQPGNGLAVAAFVVGIVSTVAWVLWVGVRYT
jgi:hypothetical protein